MAGGRSRRRSVIAPAMLAALVLSLTAAAAAQARTARLRLGETLAGAVVTNGAGYVLLTFPREGHTLKLCIRIRSCMHDWPPVTTTGRPVAGPGLDRRLLGTIPYRGRLRAVTYGGWPLHTYRFAYSARSSVMNIGIRQFGGNWYALGPTGRFVR